MRSRKGYFVWSLLLAFTLSVVSSVSIFASPPKPQPVPVTATYRDDPADALRSDDGGSYAASLSADGSKLTVPGPSCYFETTPFDDGGDCLDGIPHQSFSMCGAGETVVTPQLESFFDMSDGESQPADATARIVGNDNYRYFVRFKPTDTFVSEPNCSTHVTITRIDANHWEIEGFADDIARVVRNKIRGNGGDDWGHYLAPFKIGLSQP